MNLVQKSPEVYFAAGPISVIGEPEVALLEEALANSPRGRVRINVHSGNDDPLHEMFIAISAKSYIHPHKHKTKSEAFHLIRGAVDVVVFDDVGKITHVVPLAADGRGGSFYYRLSAPMFHTLVIKSDFLVVHEITNGPFWQGETILADFAPLESDQHAAATYQAVLTKRAAAFKPAL